MPQRQYCEHSERVRKLQWPIQAKLTAVPHLPGRWIVQCRRNRAAVPDVRWQRQGLHSGAVLRLRNHHDPAWDRHASVQLTISILNAPFKWIFATSTQTGPFTVQIAGRQESARSFSTMPLHYSLVFGTAQNPFPVLNPWTFDQNGAIQINLTDLSGAANTIWLGFIGVQLVQSTTQGT